MESHGLMLWKVGLGTPGQKELVSLVFHVAAENAEQACCLAREWDEEVGDTEPLSVVSLLLVDNFLVRPT